MKFNEARKIMQAANQVKAEIEKMTAAAGVIAKNHFVMSFRNQGFTDESIEKWIARKKADTGRAILVKSGALRRSIRVMNRGMFKVVIFSNLPYAQIHNEGMSATIKSHSRNKTFEASVRGNAGFVNGKWSRGRSRKVRLRGEAYGVGEYSVKMPKRQFIGNSGVLNRKIIAKFESQINKVFK